ncbi:MAG: nitroreductase family protein [Candidatus Aenigmatarchaeota archaeon]
MNVFKAIIERRSIRKFERREVDDKLIGVLLYMATMAPSAGNIQEWNFIVVKDEEIKKRLAKAALDQDFIAEAPIVIVVCADLGKISLRFGKRGEILYSVQDTALAVQNILLSAHALGLGSCFVGAFDEEKVKSILELTDNLRPLAILPIGYPAEQPEKPKRINFENLTWLNKYGRKLELALAVQPGQVKVDFPRPIGNIIEDKIKKGVKKKKERLTFEEFLKRLAK